MVKVSYSDVYGIRHEREHDEPIHAGDRVRTGPNAAPQFSVLAVHGDKVWLRNCDNGADGVVSIDRCRRL
jgi:hypothetical protein